MTELKIKILNKARDTIAASAPAEKLATLAYSVAYQEGDIICIELNQVNLFCEVQLDDAMRPAILYLQGNCLYFKIPFGEERGALPAKAFTGSCHVLTARVVDTWESKARRNLALNPYDGFMVPGIFPHTDANVETRNEAVFAARNAVDGIYVNNSHGKFPFGSWGVNQQEDAEWRLEFGKAVQLDELRVTLRADYPHDNYWTRGVVEFSDGSSEALQFQKTAEPQVFPIKPRIVTGLVLKGLQKAEGASPFPALTQLEAIGNYVLKEA